MVNRGAGPYENFPALKARNPLKSPVSDEKFQGKPSQSKPRIQGKTTKSAPKLAESKKFQIGQSRRGLPL
jgi:hypothetical protein